MDLVGHSFSTWIHSQLIASVIAAAFTFLEFELFGLLIDPVFRDVAFVMAAVAFVFEFIPNVGPTIALIPYMLVAASAGPVGMATVFIGWVIAQQLENAWIVPRVQSKATDLHPAVILFALVVGAALGGVLGVILAVPVTSALWRIADQYLSTTDDLDPESEAGIAPAGSIPENG
jgi:predicted PurR-regulated permease PerM